jgi:hypothetical protein
METMKRREMETQTKAGVKEGMKNCGGRFGTTFAVFGWSWGPIVPNLSALQGNANVMASEMCMDDIFFAATRDCRIIFDDVNSGQCPL